MCSTNKKIKLPPGWVAQVSTSNPGLIYYWNMHTRESIWAKDWTCDVATTETSPASSTKSSSSLSSKSNHTPESAVAMKDPLLVVNKSPLKRKIVHTPPILKTPVKNLVHKNVKQTVASPRKSVIRNKSLPAQKSATKPTAMSSKLKNTNKKQLKRTIENLPSKCAISPVKPQPQSYFPVASTSAAADISSETSDVNEPMSDMDIDFSDADEDDYLNSDVEMTDIVDVVPKEEQREAFRIVVDTNVLIHSREFIDQLKDKHLEGCGPPKIIIPWVVLTELDSIKGDKVNKKSEDLRFKAREATRYIREILKEKPLSNDYANKPSKEKQIIVLKEFEFTERLTLEPGLDWSVNDDRIAYCCLHLLKKLPQQKVILLTEDITFLNRAHTLGIRCFKPNELLDSIKVDPIYDKSFISPNRSCEKSPPDEISCIMKITYRVLEDYLREYLKGKLKKAFNESWKSKVYRRPPWALSDILECFKAHWSSVFGLWLSKNSKESIERMFKVYNESKGYICKKADALRFIDSAYVLFLELSKSDDSSFDYALKRLTELREEVTAIQSADDSQNTASVSPFSLAFSPLRISFVKTNLGCFGSRTVLPYFQFLWDIFNQDTALVLDSLDYPHSYDYEKPQVLPSRVATFDFLPKLFPTIRITRESLRRILFKGEDFTQEDMTKHLKALHQQFKVAPKMLEVKARVPELPELSELEAFCCNNHCRPMLIDAYNDVDKKLKALHDCISKLEYDETY